MPNKTFILEDSSLNIKGLKCSAPTPIASAKKFAKDIFEIVKDGKHKRVRKLTLCVKTSDKKMYTYTASKVNNPEKKDSYKVFVKPQKTPLKKRRGGADKNIKNYILITDIGRDIDDTLALITLLYLHKKNLIKLLAIAVSGGNLENRVKCVKYWLVKFDIKNIYVIEGKGEHFDLRDKNGKLITTNAGNNACVIPYDENNTSINDLVQSYEPQLCKNTLLDYFQYEVTDKNIANINILAIGPITPLRYVFNFDDFINRIDNIYFQGNAYINDNNEIIPDNREYEDEDKETKKGIGAYNFGNNFNNYVSFLQKQTQTVIEKFTELRSADNNKLYFLGKQAAYLIDFNKDDYLSIDDKKLSLGTINKTLGFARYELARNDFFRVFEHSFNKEVFKQLYNNYYSNDEGKLIAEDESFDFDDKNEKLKQYLNALIIPYNDNPSTDTERNNKVFDDILLQSLKKLNNPYDLILIYLAIFEDRFFDTSASRFYSKNNSEVTSNIKKHIHFNDKNPRILKDRVDDVKQYMLETLRTALTSTYNSKLSLLEQGKTGGKRKAKPSTSKSSPKPNTKKPAKSPSKPSQKPSNPKPKTKKPSKS